MAFWCQTAPEHQFTAGRLGQIMTFLKFCEHKNDFDNIVQ
jgi:hypothetical protein